LIFRVLKVSGHSLSPEYRDGDFVLITKLPILFGWLKPGDHVVFEQPPYGVMIKRVRSIDTDCNEIQVTGTDIDSIDSRHFGPISQAALLGKVIWHIKRPLKR
jgi:signal peptidase I